MKYLSSPHILHARACLVVLADMHWGFGSVSPRVLAYREWVLSDPARFVFVNGDVLNAATKAGPEEPTEQTGRLNQQIDAAVSFFEPLARADRILGWNGGNHERRLLRAADFDVNAEICQRLGIPSRYSGAPDEWGYSALLHLKVGKNSHGDPNHYTVFLWHGAGGGRLAGAGLNKVGSIVANVVADVYVMSHLHQEAAGVRARIVPDLRTGKLVHRPYRMVVTGPFSEYGGYQEGMGLAPAPCETPKLWFSGREWETAVEM